MSGEPVKWSGNDEMPTEGLGKMFADKHLADFQSLSGYRALNEQLVEENDKLKGEIAKIEAELAAEQKSCAKLQAEIDEARRNLTPQSTGPVRVWDIRDPDINWEQQFKECIMGPAVKKGTLDQAMKLYVENRTKHNMDPVLAFTNAKPKSRK